MKSSSMIQKLAAESKFKFSLQESMRWLNLSQNDMHDKDKIVKQYREKAKETHPDAGKPTSSQENFEKTNVAYSTCLDYYNNQSDEDSPRYHGHGELDMLSMIARSLGVKNYREHLNLDLGAGACSLILLDSQQHSDNYIVKLTHEVLGKDNKFAVGIMHQLIKNLKCEVFRGTREECEEKRNAIVNLGPDTQARKLGFESHGPMGMIIDCKQIDDGLSKNRLN